MQCHSARSSLLKVQTNLSVVSRRPCTLVGAAKKETPKMEASGYINEDNSGRGNIFPTSSKAYYRSATAEQVAGQGLGGLQGGAILLGALAVVGIATVGVISTGGSGETLASYP